MDKRNFAQRSGRDKLDGVTGKMQPQGDPEVTGQPHQSGHGWFVVAGLERGN